MANFTHSRQDCSATWRLKEKHPGLLHTKIRKEITFWCSIFLVYVGSYEQSNEICIRDSTVIALPTLKKNAADNVVLFYGIDNKCKFPRLHAGGM